MKNTVIFVLAALVIPLCFAACEKPAGDTPVLTQITVTDAPTVYLRNSTFNRNGILVKALYSDGKSAAITNYTMPDFDSSQAGVQTLFVYYQGYSAPFTVTVIEQGSVEMAEVTGGKWFSMGSDEAAAEQPPHNVILTCFYMGVYEVTQKEYEEVMGNNPSADKGDNLPVTNIDWYSAVEFCNKLSEKDNLTKAYSMDINPDPVAAMIPGADGYRLPTEAEWEYACRAGTSAPYSIPAPLGGNDISSSQANFNSAGPAAVGSYAPNQLGLYDTHGNVWEWCWDWYGAYSGSSAGNPVGPQTGDYRVARGGAWSSATAAELRSSCRVGKEADTSTGDIGFRVIRPKYPEGIPGN